jgi:CxxC motif-containing protein
MVSTVDKLICITCPRGCTLEVDHEGNTVLAVKGNGCKRGPDYARQELTDPRRKVASLVRIDGAIHPLLPVYTSAAFPKGLIPELLGQLRQVEVSAPVKTNQVILHNVLNTGIDILASREMLKIQSA